MSKDLSFEFLMKEGAKIKQSLSKTLETGIEAFRDNKKITSTSDNTKQRLNICNKCPNLSKNSGRCDMCGCFVHLKVRLDFESCPAGKW